MDSEVAKVLITSILAVNKNCTIVMGVGDEPCVSVSRIISDYFRNTIVIASKDGNDLAIPYDKIVAIQSDDFSAAIKYHQEAQR